MLGVARILNVNANLKNDLKESRNEIKRQSVEIDRLKAELAIAQGKSPDTNKSESPGDFSKAVELATQEITRKIPTKASISDFIEKYSSIGFELTEETEDRIVSNLKDMLACFMVRRLKHKL